MWSPETGHLAPLSSSLEGLVHRRVTPRCTTPVPILYNWVERDNVGQSFLSEETTRWQGLGLEPPTVRSQVQRANHDTTAPPLKPC